MPQALEAPALLTFETVPLELKAEAAGKKRFEILGYNGGAMRLPGYYYPVVVELKGVRTVNRTPLLRSHNSERIVGHVENVLVTANGIRFQGVISGVGPDTDEVLAASQNGFPWQASIGAMPERMERVLEGQEVTVNGKQFTGPLYVARQSTLREISIVAIGADDSTEVQITGAFHMDGNPAQTQPQTAPAEPEPIQAANPAPVAQPVDDPVMAYRREQTRVEDIRARCAQYPGSEPIVARAISGGWDPRDAELEAMRSSRADASHTPPNSFAGPAAAPKVLECSLVMRTCHDDEFLVAEYGERVCQAAHELHCTNLVDLARLALQADGQHAPRGRHDMIRAAFSSTSLPNALGNATGREVLRHYNEAPATWRSWCSVRSAENFKQHTSIRPSFVGQLDELGQDGEVKHGRIDESTFNWRISTYAKMLGLTRQQMIDDDIDFLQETAPAMARAAMRRVSDLIYETLLAATYFTAGNGNYETGAPSALNTGSLSTALENMRKQRDADDNDLDIMPSVLVVPPELDRTAHEVLESEFIERAADSPTGNALRNKVNIEVEPRLSNTAKFASASTTAWYMFASPQDVAQVIGFLEGRQTPNVEFFGLSTEARRLGMQWRVYHDFGSASGDYRAAHKSDGA